jgi:large subunit ribosomal protein L6
LHDLVSVELSEKEISVKVKNTDSKKEKSFWGLYRSLINNMVVGVAEGFEKKLEIIGVGYRAAASGNRLDINAGYSHPVIFELPEGISAAVEKNVITISGSDKQLVGETAARIRKIRKPEPYKGKGIKYADEVIVRKEGKAAGKDK